MAQKVSFICDVCGRVKGEANHWLRAIVETTYGHRFLVQPWDCTADLIAGVETHLCGIGCATKAMAKAMEQPEPRREAEREESA